MPCDRFEKAQRNLPEIHVRASVDPIGCLKVFMVKLSQFNLSKIEWVKKDYYSRKNGSKLTKKAPPDGLYIVL